MGTPAFAVPTLVELIDRGHHIAAVYTRAPRAAGRGLAVTSSEIGRAARSRDLAVCTPSSLRGEEATQAFNAHGAQAAVVVAYGLILPRPILEAVPYGCFNLHASALPRWRGAAPINRAIMAGDTETMVTVMRMEEGLDTGPVAMEERLPIAPDMTAGELHDAMAGRGARLMARALDALVRGDLVLTPQPARGATYAKRIDKSETRIDWRLPWRAVHDHCRGLAPFPGAWFELAAQGKPVRVKVLRTSRGEGAGEPGSVLDEHGTIACGSGAVRLVEVQRAGRQVMPAADFLRGATLTPGSRVS
ncbi:MAG: methionyl-tRNA formyltransferase [Proteobacteria bacterium]|nr:methionyl-tRNA formyltransferase [Pseudomonadota bacterium]